MANRHTYTEEFKAEAVEPCPLAELKQEGGGGDDAVAAFDVVDDGHHERFVLVGPNASEVQL